MNGIKHYIDDAIKTGLARNCADLARKLGINRSTVKRWEDGSSAPSAEEARALAELIGMPAGVLMCEAEAARAKEEATRAEWLSVARLCARQAKERAGIVGMMAAIVLFFWTSDTETAFASMPYMEEIASNAHYGALLMMIAFALRPPFKKTAQPFGRRSALRPT